MLATSVQSGIAQPCQAPAGYPLIERCLVSVMLPPSTPEFYSFGRFRFRIKDRSLVHHGTRLELTPKAGDVLLMLLEHAGNLVTKDELLDRVWGGAAVEESNVTYQIHLIRRALASDETVPEFIENVPRRGYRFVAPVTLLETPGAGDRAELTVPTAPVASVEPRSASVRAISSPASGPDATGRANSAKSPKPFVPPLHALGRWKSAYAGPAIVLAGAAATILTLANLPASRPRIGGYRQLTHDRDPKEIEEPLLMDGATVYFKKGGEAFAVPSHGGDVTPVFEAAGQFNLLDVDADGSEYLAARLERDNARPLWSLRNGPGGTRPLGTLQCDTARWSPDATRLACTIDGHLLVGGRDGTSSRRISTPPGRARFPQWSPDGRLLRFTVVTDHAWTDPTQALWEVRPDGTGLQPLLAGWHDPSDECCGVWTPDGRYFVFQSHQQEGKSDLWAVRERSSPFDRGAATPFQLTGGPLSFYGPAVAPDGKTLFAVGTSHEGELVSYDPQRRTFVPYLGGVSGIWISYAPDRSWFVYTSYPDHVLFRARTDGGGKQALTSGAFRVDGSSISPDGQWIAFRSAMAGRQMKIYLMPTGGGDPHAITDEDREQGIPSWSPDGRRFVFADVPAKFADGDQTGAIYVYDLSRRRSTLVPGSHGRWTCRWSPDGRHLAALTTVRRQQLSLFDLSTGTWRLLAADHVDNPTWSRDSQFIYYDTEGPVRMLRRVRVSDGFVQDIADLQHYPVAAPWWSGLTPDDAPLVLRNLGATEIYALEFDR